MSSSPVSEAKLPLPKFLKIMTTGDVPVAKAMAAAGKIYKKFGSPSQLSQLNDFDLRDSGIEDSGDRKLILAAFRKAGYAQRPSPVKRKKIEDSEHNSHLGTSSANLAAPGPSSAPTVRPTKRKRTSSGVVKNEFLPNDPLEERIDAEALDFKECLDESVLMSKHAVVNRAPVMTAWATVVAERLNFKRTEALSIASVYTEMNAISKGVSLGIYDHNKRKGMEASTMSNAQPYVQLMGRRPVYRTRDDEWRALTKGSPVSPMTAFGYTSRSFRQTLPYVIGAMRLLAQSYSPEELSAKAWDLYAKFRPEVEQWGKRADLACAKILSLRNDTQAEQKEKPTTPTVVNGQNHSDIPVETRSSMTLEEYEAALDDDHTFDHVDLDFGLMKKDS